MSRQSRRRKDADQCGTITLNKDTKFETGDAAVDVNHFKKGDKISVIGTKLATGELVAKEVMTTVTPSKAAGKAAADHTH